MGHVDVVTHVHWDREWYRTFDGFRARLVELVDAVLDQLEDGQLATFLLDGQTSVVDDHLEVRPDARERIARHVAAGRLRIGPWYVLADMTLVSTEALIRNLLRGTATARALGGRTDVGYCPDMFGHPPELPMLLRGFGIDTALVWRGAPPDLPAFRWRAPDGSEVLTRRERYYEPEVLWSADGADGRFAAWLDARRAQDPDGPWLLLNGGDHLAPRDLADTLAGLDTEVELRQATLEQHLAARAAAVTDRDELPVVDGPLRHPGDAGAFLLPGTLSVRARQKRRNADAQALLEAYAEPLAARAMVTPEPHGAATERPTTPTLLGLLDHAWQRLLQAHPHDSVCGCGTDQVARDTRRRLDAAIEVGEQVVARALTRLGLPTTAVADADPDVVHVAVLNGVGAPVTDTVEVEVDVPAATRPVRVLDPDGEVVPSVLAPRSPADDGPREDLVTDIATLPSWPERERVRLRVGPVAVPAAGWTTLRVEVAAADVRGSAATRAGGEVAVDDQLGPATPTAGDDQVGAGGAEVGAWHVDAGTTIRGGHLGVEVADDGTLTVTDHRTGVVVPGVGRLVDTGDRGDTYDHDAPQRDVEVVASPVEVTRRRSPVAEELHVRLRAALPVGLTDDRDGRRDATTPLDAVLVARLDRDASLVALDLEVVTTADDHRLRVHVPTASTDPSFVTDSGLTWQPHPVRGPGPLPTETGREADPGTQPAHRFVAAGTGPQRVAVLTHGHPEVAGLPRPDGTTELAVTVVRAVGQLGRHDLRTRTMGAGPPIPTPEAQEHGTHRCRLAVVVGADDAALTAAAWRWRTPLRAVPLGGPPRSVRATGVEVTGGQLSAWKPAADGDAWVVRVANPTPAPATVTVASPDAVTVVACHLDESPLPGAALTSVSEWSADLAPGGTASWRVTPPAGG